MNIKYFEGCQLIVMNTMNHFQIKIFNGLVQGKIKYQAKHDKAAANVMFFFVLLKISRKKTYKDSFK